MRESVLHWLKLYEDEVAVFLWTAALLFFVRSSGMILNNYAETVFLKRYGIEYMPAVNMINTVVTFFITGIMAAFMSRMSGAKILFYLFVFCGLVVAAIRMSIPMGLEIIYPLLFMLKSQFELLQALLFWNLANDLFNTRQAKRLFPLLTAGGVIGLIISSFGTPLLANLLHFDNLLYVYLATTLAGAALVKGMGRQFPSIMLGDSREKGQRKRNSISEEIKRVWPLLKQSTLFKIVLVLTFMPNVVIPIMNYQFNFAVDIHFPTESGMLVFFSYFRGFLNIVSLVLLLFVGRLYGSFGLPIALMLHPLNYAIAFMAFFLSFGVFSAVYARMSTNVLRTTINMPANSILIGLFPESYRAMVRPFLRGTVVRAGLLLGSALILTSVNSYHPKFLSLVALPFVLAWVAAPMVLKKKYTSILTNLVSSNMLDIKSLEEKNPGKLFKKDSAGEALVQAFLNSTGDNAIWYAKLLKSLNVDEIDALILKAIPNQDEATQVKLVEMLTENLDYQTFKNLRAMLPASPPDLRVSIIKAMRHIQVGELKLQMDLKEFRSLMADTDPEVRGYAAACLYPYDPTTAMKTIDRWLASDDDHLLRSGIIAAGETAQQSNFAPQLESMIRSDKHQSLAGDILLALHKMKSEHVGTFARTLLDHPSADVRHAALSVLTVEDAETFETVIDFLGDNDERVREQAKTQIREGRYINGQQLIASLSKPNRYLRENIFNLLETLQIKNLDLYRFMQGALEQCYFFTAKTEALGRFTESQSRQLLVDHLMEKIDLTMENIFRVLAIHSGDDRMKTLRRGLFSKNTRIRGNAIELLGDTVDKRLFKMFQPLLEGFSLNRTIAAGKQFFRLPSFHRAEEDLFPLLLKSRDWIEQVLALSILHTLADAGQFEPILRQANIITEHCASTVTPVQEAAENLWCAMANKETAMEENVMDRALTIAEKILLLRNIDIFSELSVSELGAVASVTETRECRDNETVIREGESGEEVFLIISGAVSVTKKGDGGKEIQLDTMSEGDCFGEMALFEKMTRSATIRTSEPSRFLILHKQPFNELVREYPRIALGICTALSHRLRNLQSRLAKTV